MGNFPDQPEIGDNTETDAGASGQSGSVASKDEQNSFVTEKASAEPNESHKMRTFGKVGPGRHFSMDELPPLPGDDGPDGAETDAYGEELAQPPPGAPIVTHVRGKRARCRECFLSFHVYDQHEPELCPYCGKPLVHSETEFEVAPVAPTPSESEIRDRIGKLYNRPHWLITLLISASALCLLAMAVSMQLRSIDNYHYQPLVSIYSIIAGIFVSSRFILAAFYRAPRDAGYTPNVGVLVPCMNEGGVVRQTIERIFASGYPLDKLEVICVNDGSTDNTLQEMLAAQTRHPRMIIVDFEKNRGLCHAWGVAMRISQSEFIVCVDSDTFIFPGSLNKLMQGFVDPEVGGISGHCDVENANANMLTRMQDVRYYFSYKVMKAAESVFGTVSCLPGCFSAYRRECVVKVLYSWMNATVLGEHGNFADDRSLTNRILENYKIIYDDEALATTIAPENWRQYIRQQARWQRSYVREIWKTGRFMYKKTPFASIAWYVMMWLPLFEPVVMLQALIFGPIQAGTVTPDYIFGVVSITLVWSLHFWATTGRKWWHAGLLFTFSYIVFFSWQIYWALFTIRGKKWGTRG